MAINKVIYGDQPLIDLTDDTVNSEKLKIGATAHAANGQVISGELAGVYYGTTEPTDPGTRIWINPEGMNVLHEVPYGGSYGDFLVKKSDVDYDVQWFSFQPMTSTEIDAIVE